MLRLKYGVTPLNGAKPNTPDPSKKKSRRSGNEIGNRVRLVRRRSASTSAKSVLIVAAARRLDVMLYETSNPASAG